MLCVLLYQHEQVTMDASAPTAMAELNQRLDDVNQRLDALVETVRRLQGRVDEVDAKLWTPPPWLLTP